MNNKYEFKGTRELSVANTKAGKLTLNHSLKNNKGK